MCIVNVYCSEEKVSVLFSAFSFLSFLSIFPSFIFIYEVLTPYQETIVLSLYLGENLLGRRSLNEVNKDRYEYYIGPCWK